MCVCVFVHLHGFGCGSQLRHRVVVWQQVGQLALRVQGRQRGQRLLQLADPLFTGLEQEEGGQRVNLSFCYIFVSCDDSGMMEEDRKHNNEQTRLDLMLKLCHLG